MEMTHPVVHWEIAGTDGEKLRAFYGAVFGWAPIPAGEGYWLVGPDDGGIGGGLVQVSGGDIPHVTIYIQVDDADRTLATIAELGGRVVQPPVPIPGIGRVGTFMDIEGNRIGILEPAT